MCAPPPPPPPPIGPPLTRWLRRSGCSLWRCARPRRLRPARPPPEPAAPAATPRPAKPQPAAPARQLPCCALCGACGPAGVLRPTDGCAAHSWQSRQLALPTCDAQSDLTVAHPLSPHQHLAAVPTNRLHCCPSVKDPPPPPPPPPPSTPPCVHLRVSLSHRSPTHNPFHTSVPPIPVLFPA